VQVVSKLSVICILVRPMLCTRLAVCIVKMHIIAAEGVDLAELLGGDKRRLGDGSPRWSPGADPR